ncbi:putative SEC14 protein 2 [Daphnia magna]|uniref:Putative SEC14 protein 2 n=1 Tax=Daphnia magna TaxID=35525 RepID=A0A162NBV7_9CRUS|nr:putative SEC14 protein 2 [Daphnia magna]
MGGEVPKSYYFSCKPDTANKKTLSVSSGSKEHLEFQVDKAGSVLKWNFHCEDGDIVFAVYRKQGSALIPIVPADRVDCQMSPEEGELDCDETGVYVIEFDNGFSYLRSKKIWYVISVESAAVRDFVEIPYQRPVAICGKLVVQAPVFIFHRGEKKETCCLRLAQGFISPKRIVTNSCEKNVAFVDLNSNRSLLFLFAKMDLSQFNDKQLAILKQFREIVRDCQLPNSEDAYLARWLIARDFDLTKAEKMLRNSLEWRRRYKIDSLREDFKPPDVLRKYFSAGFVGQDKLQSPLWITRYGKSDMKGILRSSKKKDFVMYVVYLVETSIWRVMSDPQKYKRSPGAIVQTTIIFDLEDLSMQHITNKQAVDAAIKIIQIYEANYPECLSRVFVINAPKIFSIGYPILKPFIHERTRNKIKIFGHDSKQWKAAILAEVNPEELPVCYGGTMTDADGNPNCISTASQHGRRSSKIILFQW